MKIVVLSGGSGNDALVKGLEKLFGKNRSFDVKVIVNACDNGKSTGVCRAVTDTLGVSDIRKNHERMIRAIRQSPDPCLLEFYGKRFNFTKGHEEEEISRLLRSWKMEAYIQYVQNFFALPKANEYEYKDFSVANIVYAEMYRELGYEKTNEHFCKLAEIDDFVVLNSFDNVFIKAQTQSGHLIQDEGETVFWNNDKDRIIKTIYDVANGEYGLNAKAIKLIEEADLILISTGTFWSSIQPTIEYLDFYKYINASTAKKIWLLNNEPDGDSWGVGSLDFVKYMEETGLRLDDFIVLVNEDANPLLKQTDDKHKFIKKAMGNMKGKHDPEKFAKAILDIYYDLDKPFDKIIFDFDDTVWSRDHDPYLNEVSTKNIRLLNEKFSDKAIIISGNSYESIQKKVATVYGENLDGFSLPVWADANSTLYIRNKVIDKIKEIELDDTALISIKKALLPFDVADKTTTIGQGRPVNIKIKPLTNKERERIKKALNALPNRDFEAKATGRTTLDVVHKSNRKSAILEKENLEDKITLYVGDEIHAGNDSEIYAKCTRFIEVKSVDETNVVLKLLEDF